MASARIARSSGDSFGTAPVTAAHNGGSEPRRRAVRRVGAMGTLLGLALVVGLAASPPMVRGDEPSAGPTLEELGLPKVAGIAMGLTHGCLWGTDGSAWCWGGNYYGELGIGTTSNETPRVPVRVQGIPGRVRHMEALETSTCALTDGGGVWCWGENHNGELGDGTTDNRALPTAVTGLGSGVVALSEGDFSNHVCAVLEDGSAVCWGENYTGQLGDGTQDERLTPVRVSVVDEKLVAISTTLSRTCVLTSGGAVRCWGWLWTDPTGKVDEAAPANLAALTPRGLGSGVTDLSVAGDTACVVVTGGEVRCWRFGQATDSANLVHPWEPGLVPGVVAGLPSGIETVLVSHYAWSDPSAEGLPETDWACGTRGGSVWCWGGNQGGQLGDGTRTDRPSPVAVTTPDIAQLDVQWGYSLALLRDGSLVTWGGEDPTPRSPFGVPLGPSKPTTAFRAPDTLVPAITTHIPTPADISTDPPVVGANLLLAALAMIMFTIATELINRSLGQADPILKRRFRPIDRLDRARARVDAALIGRFGGEGHARRANALRILGIAAFYGIVFALLDPTWNPLSITGLWLVLIMAVAFGLIGLSGDIASWAAARRWGVASELAVKPGSLVIAMGSTLFSRALVLVPGVMIGSPEALDVDASRLDRPRLGRLAGVGLGTVLAIGLVAWLATFGTAALRGGGDLLDDLVGGAEAFLLLVFAAAVQNGFVQLLSLRESAGLALRRGYRIPWAIALLGVTFVFWHTLVNPRGDLAKAAGSTNVQAFLATVGIVLVLAIVVWAAPLLTRRRGGGGARVEAQALEADASPALSMSAPALPSVPVPERVSEQPVAAAAAIAEPEAAPPELVVGEPMVAEAAPPEPVVSAVAIPEPVAAPEPVVPEVTIPEPAVAPQPVVAEPVVAVASPPDVAPPEPVAAQPVARFDGAAAPSAAWTPPAGSAPPVPEPAVTAAPQPAPAVRVKGTYVATAATTRQWISMRLATVAMAVMSVWAFVVSLQLFNMTSGASARTLSEMQLLLTSWFYVHRDLYPPIVGYSYPPLTLWVGVFLLFGALSDMAVPSISAVRKARAGLRSRWKLVFSFAEARSDADAGRTAKRQLHARGRAGLFSGGSVRIGVALVGALIVLVTSLLPPGNVTTTGLAIGDAQRGLLPTVCLVGSLLTIVGLLLSFPYGSREKLVVDFAGNVRGINEPALPPPAAAQHSAQGLAMMGSDGLPALALPGPRSSDVRARVALVSVGLTMAATGLVGAGMVFGIDLANRFDSVSRSDINQWRRLVDSMTGFYVAAYVVSVPTFLAWLSRVVDNVPALGGGKPSVSSAGAIGWWFVPIVNLFKPCLIVADVWRRLATRPREAGAGPVLAWWVLWLGGLLVMQLVAAVPEPTADAWRRVLIVQSAALVAQVVAGGLLLWIIRGIERRSETRMAALAQPIAQQAYWGPPTIAATPVVAPTGAPVAGLLPGPPPPGPRTVGPPAPVGPPVSPLPLTTVAAFCAQCGTPRTTDARFCVGCGARFELPVHA